MAAAKPAPVAAADDDTKDLPLLARLVNHIMTPGSALTKDVWIIFNIIIAGVFFVWFLFLILMPTEIMVWIFGFLCVGLALSTNWFMKEVFAAKEDFASKQAAEAENKDDKKAQ